jgi:hypothetical protein
MNINEIKSGCQDKRKQLDIDKENGYKICGKCHCQKNLDDFYFIKRTNTYENICKICHAVKATEYRKIQRETNYEDFMERQRIASLKSARKYKEERKITSLIYRRSDRGRRKRRGMKKKLMKNPEYKMKHILGKRLTNALYASGTKKHIKTLQLLGCKIQEFRKYIESQFTNGMNWENHGFGNDKWNIDHILPCELFNLTDERQQRVCFNYKNMRPAWQLDNLAKSDILDDGRNARDLNMIEKLLYLKSKGHDFTPPD